MGPCFPPPTVNGDGNVDHCGVSDSAATAC